MKKLVVCYDISLNSNRTKVMKRLRNRGFHAQLSFFELNVYSPTEVRTAVRGLLKDTDRLAVVSLNPKGKIRRIGGLLEGSGWVL